MKCSDCHGDLVGEYDLQRIICWSCHDKRGLAPQPSPPPTTEWHGKRRLPPPPPPPPMRTQHQVPTWLEPGYRVLTIAVVLALGFFLGWIARGGV